VDIRRVMQFAAQERHERRTQLLQPGLKVPPFTAGNIAVDSLNVCTRLHLPMHHLIRPLLRLPL
jgi:hypothetical protein